MARLTQVVHRRRVGDQERVAVVGEEHAAVREHPEQHDRAAVREHPDVEAVEELAEQERREEQHADGEDGGRSRRVADAPALRVVAVRVVAVVHGASQVRNYCGVHASAWTSKRAPGVKGARRDDRRELAAELHSDAECTISTIRVHSGEPLACSGQRTRWSGRSEPARS